MKQQRWKKLGLVFQPGGDRPWRLSHASTPTAEVLAGSLVRVYFTSRDAQNRSHISSLECDLRQPAIVRALRDEPLVAPGAAGAFDEAGVSMGCLVKDGDRRLLYYLGWNLSDKTVPWRNSVGVAIASGNSLTFEKLATPAIPVGGVDPHSISYPWVLKEGTRWRAWYGSTLSWGATKDTMRFVIKYAESDDGVHWHRDGRVAIPVLERTAEYSVSRPCVVREGGRWLMWHSRLAPEYRLGYAESDDGLTWTRSADAVLDPTLGAWDGKSVEYACVFDADGDRWMLYNGDDYGRAGFGLAILAR